MWSGLRSLLQTLEMTGRHFRFDAQGLSLSVCKRFADDLLLWRKYPTAPPKVLCIQDLGKSWVDNRPQIYGQSGEMKAYDKEGQIGFNLFFTATGPGAGMYLSADTGRSWRLRPVH